MGKLVLDEVRSKAQHFIQHGARHGSEAMCRHVACAIAKASHCCVDGVIAHEAIPTALRGEDIITAPRERFKVLQDLDRLCRKGRDISRMVTSYNETIDRLQPSETSAKAGDLAQLLKDMAQ